MFGTKSPLAVFKEKASEAGGNPDIIWRSQIVVKGIPQESPPYINTCNTNSFLTALRFSFFYDHDGFVQNFKHKRPGPKKIEDALRVIGLLCREIDVDPSLVKMAWNTISKVRPFFILVFMSSETISPLLVFLTNLLKL